MEEGQTINIKITLLNAKFFFYIKVLTFILKNDIILMSFLMTQKLPIGK